MYTKTTCPFKSDEEGVGKCNSNDCEIWDDDLEI